MPRPGLLALARRDVTGEIGQESKAKKTFAQDGKCHPEGRIYPLTYYIVSDM
jgi:hypothetical protein